MLSLVFCTTGSLNEEMQRKFYNDSRKLENEKKSVQELLFADGMVLIADTEEKLPRKFIKQDLRR